MSARVRGVVPWFVLGVVAAVAATACGPHSASPEALPELGTDAAVLREASVRALDAATAVHDAGADTIDPESVEPEALDAGTTPVDADDTPSHSETAMLDASSNDGTIDPEADDASVSATSTRPTAEVEAGSAPDLELDAGLVEASTIMVDSGGHDDSVPIPELDGGAYVPPLAPVSGYIDIEPLTYAIDFGRTEHQSSSARLFYSLFPADDDPAEAPVFVFFNGGPGFATSAGLLPFGTAPYTMAPNLAAPRLESNPHSWATLGSLLYIDSRQTGFSYSRLGDPSDANAREAEFGQHNFNEYLDAADFVRVLLRVLEQNEMLRDNPVVLVGESYGGVRATLMLYYLRAPEALRQEGYYRDIALADEIEQHDATVSSAAAPATPADQFRTQILIQPWIGHTQGHDQYRLQCASGSPEAVVAQELGASCSDVLSSNDPYNIQMPPTWTTDLGAAAQAVLSDRLQLPVLLGVEPGEIPGFPAEQRLGAFRIGGSPPAGDVVTPTTPDFVDAYGALPSWDFYHMLYSFGGYASFYDNPVPCVLFNDAVQHVDTFVTHAFMDTVVRTSVIPTTLAACNQLYQTPPLDSVVLEETPTAGVERPGWMRFRFNENSSIGNAERIVRVPRYERAGHMVTVTHAAELFADVSEFLQERGVIHR